MVAFRTTIGSSFRFEGETSVFISAVADGSPEIVGVCVQGFSPMNKYGLQMVMKLASCYGLKSSAQGSGKKQFVVVYFSWSCLCDGTWRYLEGLRLWCIYPKLQLHRQEHLRGTSCVSVAHLLQRHKRVFVRSVDAYVVKSVQECNSKGACVPSS